MLQIFQLRFIPLYLLVGTLLISGAAFANREKFASPIQAEQCTAAGRDIQVSVGREGFSPRNLAAERCDRLVFINKSGQERRIAFGLHDRHVQYPGFSERLLVPGSSVSVVLTAAGNFVFHDHYKEADKGEVVVRYR
ncbi:MAG TPA: hypothetical protein VK978_01930 [Candidatus Saccharimonadales bacterium]|nr:hypothetical protein [Candidatus Saccharimonadales bacterium]